jgi:LacI family transcriptional regulator
MERDLKQYGLSVEQSLFNPCDAESFIEQAKLVTDSKPRGFILAPIFYRETLSFFEEWKASEIPFVLFNTQIADYEPLN